MNRIRSVIFDVDGVLLDSLEPHLKICRDKNKEYDLGLDIPGSKEIKSMVIEGVKISPMRDFFKAVGFPKDYAIKADQQYQKIFNKYYLPKPFPGIDQMLKALSNEQIELGIVTANVLNNIKSALGSSLDHFNPECIFTNDDPNSLSKVNAIKKGAHNLKVPLENIIYVGDQPKDMEAAHFAGVKFLGVTYGWGIDKGEKAFPVVHDVLGISNYVLNLLEGGDN